MLRMVKVLSLVLDLVRASLCIWRGSKAAGILGDRPMEPGGGGGRMKEVLTSVISDSITGIGCWLYIAKIWLVSAEGSSVLEQVIRETAINGDLYEWMI